MQNFRERNHLFEMMYHFSVETDSILRIFRICAGVTFWNLDSVRTLFLHQRFTDCFFKLELFKKFYKSTTFCTISRNILFVLHSIWQTSSSNANGEKLSQEFWARVYVRARTERSLMLTCCRLEATTSRRITGPRVRSNYYLPARSAEREKNNCRHDRNERTWRATRSFTPASSRPRYTSVLETTPKLWITLVGTTLCRFDLSLTDSPTDEEISDWGFFFKTTSSRSLSFNPVPYHLLVKSS